MWWLLGITLVIISITTIYKVKRIFFWRKRNEEIEKEIEEWVERDRKWFEENNFVRGNRDEDRLWWILNGDIDFYKKIIKAFLRFKSMTKYEQKNFFKSHVEVSPYWVNLYERTWTYLQKEKDYDNKKGE